MQIPRLRGQRPLTLGKRAIREFMDDDMTTYAAAMAYRALFSLFPFLVIALLGFLRIPEFFDQMLEQVRPTLPQDTYERLRDGTTGVQSQWSGGLLSIGVLGALWATASGIRSLMKALNTAYDVEESRSPGRVHLLSILCSIGLAILVIASVTLMLPGPHVIEWLVDQIDLGGAYITVWTWLRWPVALLLLTLAAALIFSILPDIDQPFTLITPGSAIAVVVWILASIGFSIYVSSFANFRVTTAILGGIIVLLLCFFIAVAVLLLGAEINAEVRQGTEGDPTPEENTSVS